MDKCTKCGRESRLLVRLDVPDVERRGIILCPPCAIPELQQASAITASRIMEPLDLEAAVQPQAGTVEQLHSRVERLGRVLAEQVETDTYYRTLAALDRPWALELLLEEPVALVRWAALGGLIGAARARGITRHVDKSEEPQAMAELAVALLVHVARCGPGFAAALGKALAPWLSEVGLSQGYTKPPADPRLAD